VSHNNGRSQEVSNDDLLSYLRPERSQIKFPHPHRQTITDAFDTRVKDAIKMMASGNGNEAIREKHGSIVLDAAKFRWTEFWATKTINSDGHVVEKNSKQRKGLGNFKTVLCEREQ
jgi:hypothetical protein